MRFRLIPRDEGFFELFAQSAINIDEGAQVLAHLLGDLEDIDARVDHLFKMEKRGDELTREILQRLDRAIVTPFDREDIHALAEHLDDVADRIRGVGDLVRLHHVSKPLASTVELSQLLARASACNVRMISKLGRLRGMQPEIDEINAVESEGDGVYRRGLAQLYSGEFKAFEVLRWQDIVSELEEALDGFEDVAYLVATIAVKHA
jgi:predicted phosphate transport protein (TIGR00153 family)